MGYHGNIWASMGIINFIKCSQNVLKRKMVHKPGSVIYKIN